MGWKPTDMHLARSSSSTPPPVAILKNPVNNHPQHTFCKAVTAFVRIAINIRGRGRALPHFREFLGGKRMNTATAFEQMANAIPYIDKLVNSKEMKAFVEEKSKGDVVGRDILMKMLPILYAKHPKETMGILGAMHGKTAEEVAEMDFTETAAMMDKDTLDSLFAFFTFALRLGCIM
jgi:hypothetical protein